MGKVSASGKKPSTWRMLVKQNSATSWIGISTSNHVVVLADAGVVFKLQLNTAVATDPCGCSLFNKEDFPTLANDKPCFDFTNKWESQFVCFWMLLDEQLVWFTCICLKPCRPSHQFWFKAGWVTIWIFQFSLRCPHTDHVFWHWQIVTDSWAPSNKLALLFASSSDLDFTQMSGTVFVFSAQMEAHLRVAWEWQKTPLWAQNCGSKMRAACWSSGRKNVVMWLPQIGLKMDSRNPKQLKNTLSNDDTNNQQNQRWQRAFMKSKKGRQSDHQAEAEVFGACFHDPWCPKWSCLIVANQGSMHANQVTMSKNVLNQSHWKTTNKATHDTLLFDDQWQRCKKRCSKRPHCWLSENQIGDVAPSTAMHVSKIAQPRGRTSRSKSRFELRLPSGLDWIIIAFLFSALTRHSVHSTCSHFYRLETARSPPK